MFGLQKAFRVGGRKVTKSVSGTPPGGFAGRVFSCQISVLLRRSHFEVCPIICLSCAKLGALHSHVHQTVVQELLVSLSLRSHVMLDTSRLHGCVC